MNMIKVSNIMGIDPKPFDPKTYVEEDTFVTDESGSKKRIRLENNIVRWRTVRNPDGMTSVSFLLLSSLMDTNTCYSWKGKQIGTRCLLRYKCIIIKLANTFTHRKENESQMC